MFFGNQTEIDHLLCCFRENFAVTPFAESPSDCRRGSIRKPSQQKKKTSTAPYKMKSTEQ